MESFLSILALDIFEKINSKLNENSKILKKIQNYQILFRFDTVMK